MKIYFAGADGEKFSSAIKDAGARNLLVSYFNFRHPEKITDERVFLDSGAFTAWSQKKEIDINKYAEFLKEWKDKFEVYANLDVIGDAEATLKNQKKLEKHGLDPLPTFHYKSDIKYLKYYAKNYEYIALGGLVPISKEQTIFKWLDYCFKYLVKEVQNPAERKRLKIHAFGVSNPEVLLRYPFYSCDSTSWLLGGKFGRIAKWKDFKLIGVDYKKKKDFIQNSLSQGFVDHYMNLNQFNIKEFLKMQKDITKVWERRGIKFNE